MHVRYKNVYQSANDITKHHPLLAYIKREPWNLELTDFSTFTSFIHHYVNKCFDISNSKVWQNVPV